jgi:hypothetical protein
VFSEKGEKGELLLLIIYMSFWIDIDTFKENSNGWKMVDEKRGIDK